LTWRDTPARLLTKMVPDNEKMNDKDKTVVDEVNAYTNSNLESLISVEKVETALKRVRNKKAPGLDDVNSEIVKRLWYADREVIIIIFNNCLRNSSFHETWKQEKLRPILKDVQKDLAQFNSYRPIALLPVMGKVFERIIVNRIQDLYEDRELNNNKQFDFRTGQGTEDALRRIVRLSKNNETKYAL